MAEFDIERLSMDGRNRMTVALKDVGVAVHPPLDTVHRKDTVVLSPAVDRSDGVAPSVAAQELSDVLTVRICHPNQPVSEAALSDLDPTHGETVIWFDISDGSKLDPAAVLAALNPH